MKFSTCLLSVLCVVLAYPSAAVAQDINAALLTWVKQNGGKTDSVAIKEKVNERLVSDQVDNVHVAAETDGFGVT